MPCLLLCWSAFDGNAQVTFNLSDQVAVAYRVDTPPAIDGALNDVAWRTDPSATQFTQNRPFPRSAPTHRTEVWIAYDDDNLYIGAQMHDTAPDSILQQLSVRDRVENPTSLASGSARTTTASIRWASAPRHGGR